MKKYLILAIVLAVGLTALVAVLVRAAMTLADISGSLEKLAEGRQAPAPAMAAAVRSAVDETRDGQVQAQAQAEETDLVAVIAVARAAMDGSLPIAP